MGIPSYFAHLLRTYPELVKKFRTPVDNLYMDANSILYEVFYASPEATDEEHYKMTCQKIRDIISLINPAKCIYIAFDGIAPIAKLAQQRDRRIKSEILRRMKEEITGERQHEAYKLTCGTRFMTNLGPYMKEHMTEPNIFISPPTEVGEGEHKLFYHIRNHKEYHLSSKTAIYGLDADLIMLCLLHSEYNLYILREMPHFYRRGEGMAELSISKLVEKLPIPYKDYVLLCFLLGNDFLPHFPSLNIRTSGINTLLENYEEPLVERTVNLNALKKYLKKIAIHEQELLCVEMETRARMEEKVRFEDKYKDAELKPLRSRDKEHWIDPTKKYWEDRYYAAFEMVNIRELSVNYITGLIWCWEYYTNGLKGIRNISSWYYKAAYPPLLRDIVSCLDDVPPGYFYTLHMRTIEMTNDMQLCYVIPPNYRHKYIPLAAYKKVYGTLPDELDYNEVEMETSYCKFLWECHPIIRDMAALYFPSIEIIESKLRT
jgi:5'-3' exonuclease